MENILPRKFDPSTFQTEHEGSVHLLSSLSRDDLMQVACECMQALELVEGVQVGLRTIMEEYRSGRICPEPGPVEFAVSQCRSASIAVRDLEGAVAKKAEQDLCATIESLSGLPEQRDRN